MFFGSDKCFGNCEFEGFFLWEIVVFDDRLREKVECEWFAAID